MFTLGELCTWLVAQGDRTFFRNRFGEIDAIRYCPIATFLREEKGRDVTVGFILAGGKIMPIWAQVFSRACCRDVDMRASDMADLLR